MMQKILFTQKKICAKLKAIYSLKKKLSFLRKAAAKNDIKIRVYLVDDELPVLEWLTNNIAWDYYSCSVEGFSTSAQDALAFISDYPIDLLITDVTMPDMDGISLIRKAKQIGNNLKVIVISAYSNFEFIKQALLLGVENYLLKPIDTKELGNTLQQLAENFVSDVMSISSPAPLVFRNNLLQQWVRNEFWDLNFIEHAEMAHLDLSCNSYTVAAIRIISSDMNHRYKLFEFCTQLDFIRDGYFFIDRSSDIIVILPSTIENYIAPLGQLYKKLTKSTNFPICMSVGPSVTSYRKVHISYQTAIDYLLTTAFLCPSMLNCMDYSYFLYDPINHDKDVLDFKNCIKNNNVQQAVDLSNILMEKNDLFSYCNRAIALAVNLLQMLHQPYTFTDLQYDELLQFTHCSTKVQILNWIHRMVRMVSQIESALTVQLHPYVSKAINYIKKNYSNPNLSLQFVADNLNINSAYLGQLFRSQVGKYFNDYLSDVRLETSCTLLIETPLHINAIAQKIGISNQSYFNRIFKKKYTITPVEYRQRYCEIQCT